MTLEDLQPQLVRLRPGDILLVQMPEGLPDTMVKDMLDAFRHAVEGAGLERVRVLLTDVGVELTHVRATEDEPQAEWEEALDATGAER